MLKIEQYQKLKAGDQIRYAKEIYTVHGHEDFGTHRECKLITDNGLVLHNGIYITHLMAYHGSIDIEPTVLSGVAGASILPPATLASNVIENPLVEPKTPLMPERDEKLLRLYQLAELV